MGVVLKGGKGKRGGEKIYIIIGDETYFISIKVMKKILDGTQERAAIRGYD